MQLYLGRNTGNHNDSKSFGSHYFKLRSPSNRWIIIVALKPKLFSSCGTCWPRGLGAQQAEMAPQINMFF